MASFLNFDIKKNRTVNLTMPRKASTHRLEPDVQAGLNHLSKVLHRPKNKLMNEAVSRFVQERSIQLVQEMEGVINSLKKYQRSDPDFERAIERLVNDEVAQAGADPLEGRPAGAVQAEIRGLLHA
jgi:hypothetical protein